MRSAGRSVIFSELEHTLYLTDDYDYPLESTTIIISQNITKTLHNFTIENGF